MTRKAAATKRAARPKLPVGSKTDTFTVSQTCEFNPPAARLYDLAKKGPVHLLQGEKGMGLLIHHLSGPTTVSLVSLTTGQGFMLSRESARVLGALLSSWAEGDTFALAG